MNPRTRRRRAAERGAVLVEFSMVALLLFVLAGGAYDYGQGWRAGIAVNESVRTGARVASAVGPARSADFDAMSGLKASLASSGKLAGLQRVVIFQATSTNGQVPPACTTMMSSSCQIITGDAFRTGWENQSVASATTTEGCLQIASTKTWCPTTRNNVQSTAQYYGVWVEVKQDNLFPIIGNSLTIRRTAVMRLEPKVDL